MVLSTYHLTNVVEKKGISKNVLRSSMGVPPQTTANPALASCVLDTLLKCLPNPLVWGTPASFQIRFRGCLPPGAFLDLLRLKWGPPCCSHRSLRCIIIVQLSVS